MKGELTLYRDQYGNTFFADTVKDLCAQLGRSKARKMYTDAKDGSVRHVGYVVGQHWLRAYKPI